MNICLIIVIKQQDIRYILFHPSNKVLLYQFSDEECETEGAKMIKMM